MRVKLTNLVVSDKSSRAVVQDLSCFRSSWRPGFLPRSLSSWPVTEKETYLDIIEERRDEIHVRHFGKPIVHLDIDICI